jgi:pimeloyl-ACP methyl ester carboxylesterase
MIETSAQPRREYRTVNGSVVSLQRAGRGEPLVFLAGASSIDAWPPFLRELSARYEVIVPDHPGFGESETPPWLRSVHDVAYAYLDLFEQLGVRGVHLAGHALGGWIACEIAVRSDRDLRSLALVAPAGIRVPGVRKLDTYLMSPEAVAQHAYVDPSLQARSARPDPDDEHALDVYLKDQLNYARLGWQPLLFDPDLDKWLHRIGVPTLVVWGADDLIIPPAYLDAFVRLIPKSRRALIEDAGHFPQIEASTIFLERLIEFYDAVAAHEVAP